MNLTETPEQVRWPETHLVYFEKTGPFQTAAPEAWTTLHKLVPSVLEHNKISGYSALYKVEPDLVYRATVAVDERPKTLPEGLHYALFAGGTYARFVLQGPYSDLPAASGRVFEIVKASRMRLRDDFYIENYVSDPRQTNEQELITHILVPVA